MKAKYIILPLLPVGALAALMSFADFRPLQSGPPAAQAQAPLNVAAAANGATILVPEEPDYSCREDYPVEAIIDGDRKGLNFGNGGVYSTCPEQFVAQYSSTSQQYRYSNIYINFNAMRTISQVNIFTAQDNLTNPAEPTPEMTFATEGVTSIVIYYWDPSTAQWNGIEQTWFLPHDYKVWKTATFPAITTNRIMIRPFFAPSQRIRITEVEALQSSTDHSDFGVYNMTLQRTLIPNSNGYGEAFWYFMPNYPNNGGPWPTRSEFYPLIYSFSNIPDGMGFYEYETDGYGSAMYAGIDCIDPNDESTYGNCPNKYLPQYFRLKGNPAPGTYYITATVTEQLAAGVTRAPWSHNYTFRLDVLGTDIKANGSDSNVNIVSGNSAAIAWETYIDPDPSAYAGSPVSCTVTPSGWTGMSGSQSSGPLTSARTYTSTCGFPWGQESDSVTVNVTQEPNTVFHFLSQTCPNYSNIAGNNQADQYDDTGGHFSEFSNFQAGPTFSPLPASPVSPSEIPVQCQDAAGWSFIVDDQFDFSTATNMGSTNANGELQFAFSSLPSNVKNTLLAGGLMWVREVTQQSASFGALRCYYDAQAGDNREYMMFGTDPINSYPLNVYCIAYNIAEITPPTDVRVFNTATDQSVPCGQIKVIWSQSGSYDHNVYRDGALLATMGDPSISAYLDTPPVGSSSLSYSVAAFDSYGLSDLEPAMPAVIAVSPCSSNLTGSDIDVTRVNDSAYPNTPCSGETELIASSIVKEDDTITFKINLCNTGNQTVPQLSFTAQLTNLSNPRNFAYNGCSPIASGSGNALTVSNIGNLTPGTVCSVEFDASVETEGDIEYINRLRVAGTIYSNGIAYGPLNTPPLPYFNISQVPQRYESAP